jgi:hypothetical protein
VTDRCDRCAGRATVLVVLRSGGELAFCDHHTRKYRAALMPRAVRFEHHVELEDLVAAPGGRRADTRRIPGR